MVFTLEVIHEPLIVAYEDAMFFINYICMEENDIVLMSLLF
jgi:hypothetical protein